MIIRRENDPERFVQGTLAFILNDYATRKAVKSGRTPYVEFTDAKKIFVAEFFPTSVRQNYMKIFRKINEDPKNKITLRMMVFIKNTYGFSWDELEKLI